MKRFQYLLGQTELFEHFLELKVRFEAWLVVADHDASSTALRTRLTTPRIILVPQKSRDPDFAAMLDAQVAKKQSKAGKGKKKEA